MSKCKGRHIFVFLRKIAKGGNGAHQKLFHAKQSIPHQYYIRIVPHITGGCSEMDYGLRLRTHISISMDMGHYIMSEFRLVFCSLFIVNIIDVLLHFPYLPVTDVKPQLLFTFRQSNPELSPGGKFMVCGKDFFHLISCIAGAKRIFINIFHRPDLQSLSFFKQTALNCIFLKQK